ncbi:MAG: hypothetical protein K5756_10315 [Clostridiales bacterium]|nr:hypothetical protein [Clostridiales bacterium]
MENVDFTPDEKIEAFDKLARRFYKCNFGQMSKADFELLMFNIILKKIVSENSSQDGIIDFNKCSDYQLSKILGITQQRVRNLKIKSQLAYPIEFDWQKALASLLENARFDQATKKIMLNIPDPNLFIEIQNYIEEKGAYIEVQLNKKILQIRAEYFIDLVVSLEEETKRNEIVKEIKKRLKEANKDETKFVDREIGKSLIEATVNITEIVANISSLISPGNVLGKSLVKFFS